MEWRAYYCTLLRECSDNNNDSTTWQRWEFFSRCRCRGGNNDIQALFSNAAGAANNIQPVDGIGQNCNSICNSGRLIVLQPQLSTQGFIVFVRRTRRRINAAAGLFFICFELWLLQVGCFRGFLLAPSLAFIIIFVFDVMPPLQLHGDAGDHPPPSENAIHSASSIFRVIRTRRKVFLLISTPPLGPSSLIRHSKAVFKKSGASLSYGNSRCSCRRFFWSTRFFWYCCEAASVGRRRYFCSTTINHCGIA